MIFEKLSRACFFQIALETIYLYKFRGEKYESKPLISPYLHFLNRCLHHSVKLCV